MRWLLLVVVTGALSIAGYLMAPRVLAPEVTPPNVRFDFDDLLTYARSIPAVPDMEPIASDKAPVDDAPLAQISVGRSNPFRAIQPSTADPITRLFADIRRLQEAVQRYRSVTGSLPTADGKPGPLVLGLLQPHYLREPLTAVEGLSFTVSDEGTVAIENVGRGAEINATLTFWSPHDFTLVGLSINDEGRQQAVLEIDGMTFVVTRDTILRNIRVVDISVTSRSVTLLDEKNLVQATLYLNSAE